MAIRRLILSIDVNSVARRSADISMFFDYTANDFSEILAREPTTCTGHISTQPTVHCVRICPVGFVVLYLEIPQSAVVYCLDIQAARRAEGSDCRKTDEFP